MHFCHGRTKTKVDQQYRQILRSIRQFAEDLLNPFLSNPKEARDIIKTAQNMPDNVKELRRYFSDNPDLARATYERNVDVDIAEAIIYRFVMEHIFLDENHPPCFASRAQIDKLTAELEAQISANSSSSTQARGGDPALRNRVRAGIIRHFLLNSKPYQKSRAEGIDNLARRLSVLLIIFRMQGWGALVKQCQQAVVEPCVAFHEAMQKSADPSYNLRLDLLPTQKDLLGRLGTLDCTNIEGQGQGQGSLDLGLDPGSVKLEARLSHILAITPALVGQQMEPLKQPEYLVRQRVLVRDWIGSQSKGV